MSKGYFSKCNGSALSWLREGTLGFKVWCGLCREIQLVLSRLHVTLAVLGLCCDCTQKLVEITKEGPLI